jgi:hypothetical protein
MDSQREVEICNEYNSGSPLRKTAKAFGISHERVRQILLKNGNPVRWRDNMEATVSMPAEKIGRSLLQELVDGAQSLLNIDAARQYGLINGGPMINCERCIEILDAGLKRDIKPRKNAFEKFIKQNSEMFSHPNNKEER